MADFISFVKGWRAGVLALLLASASAPLHAEPFRVESFEAHYNVKLDGFKVGELEQRVVARADGTWLLETIMQTTGVVSWFKSDKVVEQSVMRAIDDTLQPLSYSYRYTGRNKDVVERIDFDWNKMQVSSLRDGKITLLPAEKGLLDKQVYQLLVRRDLARGLKSMSYPVAERSRLTTFETTVAGEETLVTPFGKFRTIKVQRGATTLWCAPELGYAVVKLERHEDGHSAVSYITSLTRK
ncbi:MAG TPA: DUF3108 domain-containing protein [Gammaproteobacteria bacterium]